MKEKITLESLNSDFVYIKKEKFVAIDGEEIKVGQPHRKAYQNNEDGRQQVIDELPQEYQNAIFAIWGVENAE